MDSDEKPSLSWTKKLVNQHYLVNKRKYFFQCTLATIVVLVLLSTLDLISNNLIISSVASTTFVTFTCPHHKLTKARYVIGGYLVGIVVGLLCYYFMLGATNLFGELSGLADELVGAISVGASIFFMTVLNLEHPPAAAISLAMVVLPWSIASIVMTMAFIICLCSFRKLLENHLIGLI